MTIGSHIETFGGLPVVEFQPDAEGYVEPADPAAVAWRVATDYDAGKVGFAALLTALLDRPWIGQVRALIIGEWGESYETSAPIDRLTGAADRLTSLRALPR